MSAEISQIEEVLARHNQTQSEAPPTSSARAASSQNQAPVLVQKLMATLANRKVPITSAMDLLRFAMEIADTFPKLSGRDKKARVIEALQVIAAGKDGISGTKDDLIPVRVMQGLKSFIEDEDLLKDAIDLIIAATKGHLDMNKALNVAQRFALFLASLCGSMKEPQQSNTVDK